MNTTTTKTATIRINGVVMHTGLEVKECPLWFHLRGLSQTATGYGSRIATVYMIKLNNVWRRVYCRIYSNSGSTYIGKLGEYDDTMFVDID